MGDASKTELSEAESDAFDAKRSEAMAALGEGEWQKASELFTEAIKVWVVSPFNIINSSISIMNFGLIS